MRNASQPGLFNLLNRADVPHDDLKAEAASWFETLRDTICQSFEHLEVKAEKAGSQVLNHRTEAGRFSREAWSRHGTDAASLHGGGVMSVMRGRVFEKVGINVSTVWGAFSSEFRQTIPGAETDPRFFATGISLVAHPCNPHVPAAHFNTRLIITTKGWFGGGGDITPMFPSQQDAQDDAAAFHTALQNACDAHDPNYYKKFKEWCDRYFFLPHRNEPRGLGGIFYDHLCSGDARADFAFTQDVGRAFLNAYPKIVAKRMMSRWTEDAREAQLVRRGRYVEFNLIHDRGTIFGLKTGGHTEAILMSMPPEVKWP